MNKHTCHLAPCHSLCAQWERIRSQSAARAQYGLMNCSHRAAHLVLWTHHRVTGNLHLWTNISTSLHLPVPGSQNSMSSFFFFPISFQSVSIHTFQFSLQARKTYLKPIWFSCYLPWACWKFNPFLNLQHFHNLSFPKLPTSYTFKVVQHTCQPLPNGLHIW